MGDVLKGLEEEGAAAQPSATTQPGAVVQPSANQAGEGEGGSRPVAMLFSQADVDRIVKDRLEREKAAREKALAKARDESEAEALKKNQEWQTLAERNAAKASELQAKLGELEPLSDQVVRLSGALEKYLEAEKKELPKHVLVLLEKLDAVDQMEYLAANREAIGRPGRVEGVPASPNAKQRSLSEEELEAARRGQAALYTNF
jgi:hypothetical protein